MNKALLVRAGKSTYQIFSFFTFRHVCKLKFPTQAFKQCHSPQPHPTSVVSHEEREQGSLYQSQAVTFLYCTSSGPSFPCFSCKSNSPVLPCRTHSIDQRANSMAETTLTVLCKH